MTDEIEELRKRHGDKLAAAFMDLKKAHGSHVAAARVIDLDTSYYRALRNGRARVHSKMARLISFHAEDARRKLAK